MSEPLELLELVLPLAGGELAPELPLLELDEPLSVEDDGHDAEVCDDPWLPHDHVEPPMQAL